MKAKKSTLESKAGCVAARLTAEQQARVEKCADECGMTVSEWARMVLVEALEDSPRERRMMTFMAAQNNTVLVALEEWQNSQDLAARDVQDRIQRVAAERAKDSVRRMKTTLARLAAETAA